MICPSSTGQVPATAFQHGGFTGSITTDNCNKITFIQSEVQTVQATFSLMVPGIKCFIDMFLSSSIFIYLPFCWFLKYLPFQYGNCKEESNYDCGQHLQQVCIDSEPDNNLEYQIIQDGTKSNAQQAKCKVAENFSEDRFANDDSGKTDNDSSTSHVDIGKSLILLQRVHWKEQPVRWRS